MRLRAVLVLFMLLVTVAAGSAWAEDLASTSLLGAGPMLAQGATRGASSLEPIDGLTELTPVTCRALNGSRWQKAGLLSASGLLLSGLVLWLLVARSAMPPIPRLLVSALVGGVLSFLLVQFILPVPSGDAVECLMDPKLRSSMDLVFTEQKPLVALYGGLGVFVLFIVLFKPLHQLFRARG